MTQRYAYLLLFVCLAMLAFVPTRLEAQEREPYSIDQIIELIESRVFSDTRIEMLVGRSCIDFRVDEEAARRLSAAGASSGLIESLRGVCVELASGFVDAVIVTPAELEMEVGATDILRARAIAPDSTPVTGVVFEWTSADTAVAVVSGGGTVLAKAPGAVRIAATTQEGPSGTALVRVAVAAAAEPENREAEVAGAKSVGTAAALGVVVPGGGELYTGNTGKGLAVLAGSAAALAAGYFITTDEVIGSSYTADGTESCTLDPGTGAVICTYPVIRTDQVEETRQIVYGAVAAGALWLYGLIDGIRNAKKSQIPPAEAEAGGPVGGSPGTTLELAPLDGIRYTASGELEVTLLRIRS
ncbi:MAG: Ig-like domain-containing protein [Gemmatimonadota bacterium]|nr:MAG: Ig-like domain-containing protein [Gemmatimonadota bacterium]